MNNEKNEKGYYHLPGYNKLLSFPNFKLKLAKKLEIKREILTVRLAMERQRVMRVKQYEALLEAEITMITFLLETKKIKDDI